MTIRGHVQAFDLGARVSLFEIDLTLFDLGIIRIAPFAFDDEGVKEAISFGGELYAPHPVQHEGYEVSAGGSLPRPQITLANLDNSFTALVEQHDDLHGGIVTRIRTYDRYLDNGPEPDGDSHQPLEVYELSQKTSHTQEQISWAMAARMDQEGVELPARTMVRDYCNHTTRRWDSVAGAFDYTGVTCPYVGAPKDENGIACAAIDEVFSKRLSTCCQARFGVAAVLPTRAFPGIARLRTR